ncbi:MAG: hypothetical protein HRT99_01445 [Mycoplasmatales bacterium]|nr:hypothetical protein [Mycoplasmatales bacterium]
MIIPKKLHYIWIGNNPIPSRIREIMDNNKKILGKNWEIKIWTEKDFDFMDTNPYVKYWYSKKQWSFVSDFLRAYVVNLHGGFYFDTDIVLSKTLDPFLNTRYIGSRTSVSLNNMSIFGSEKNSKILDTYLEIIQHPKLIKKPPKIMATHFHTYSIRKYYEIPNENEDYVSENITILREDKLQLDLKNGENIALHEHHNNWKGNKEEVKISKYYSNKIKNFKKTDEKFIKEKAKKVDKIMKKIEKLLK